MAALPEYTVGALAWQLYAQGSKDLIAAYLVDLTAYADWRFTPSGVPMGSTLGTRAADGVVIDNMDGVADLYAQIGPVITKIPRYQKSVIPIGPGQTSVIITGGGTPRVYFYAGTFHGQSDSVSFYSAQKMASENTLTSGTVDAYLQTLRWKFNFNLANGYNLDNLTDSGFYDVLNPTNGGTPLAAGTWYIEHHTYSASNLYAFQIARNLVAPKAAIFERRLLGGNGWTPWTASGGAAGNGQCRFSYASPTSCALVPRDGQSIIVNGAVYKLPQAGLNLSNAGLAAITAYNVFLQVAGDGVTGSLLASTTAHVTGADGTEVMSGDATKALVGWVFTDSAGKFQFTPSSPGVMSWFNRQPFIAQISASGTTTSGNFVELTQFRFTVPAWSGSTIRLTSNVNAAGSFNGVNGKYSRILVNGNTIGTDRVVTQGGAWNSNQNQDGRWPTQGDFMHTVTYQVATSAQDSTTWSGEINAETWI